MIRRKMNKDNNVALEIIVRRIKTSPYYEVDFGEIPQSPVLFAALLNIIQLTCVKTINDISTETGYFTDIQK